MDAANIDSLIFSSINGLAGKWPVVDAVGIFFAEYLQYFLAVVLVAALFYPKEKRKYNRLMVTAGLAAALFSRFAVKAAILLFYEKPRPYMALESANKLIATWSSEDFQSFPSGHALFFFALAAAIFGFNKKLGMRFFAASILISMARVFAGAHWPSDIFAGATIGLMVGGAVFLTTEKVLILPFKKKTDRKSNTSCLS